jgi:hypothetical protein
MRYVPTVALFVSVFVVLAVVGVAARAAWQLDAVDRDAGPTLGVFELLELGARARSGGLSIVDVDRRSDTRLILELADGTALDLVLFWERAADPERLVDLTWWDEVGWVARFEMPGLGAQNFYAWRCRMVAPVQAVAGP